MKRPLLVAAALLAAATPLGAAAQQPMPLITTYGVLDAGLARIRSGSPRARYAGSTLGWGSSDASGKAQFASASMMNNGTSRFGLQAHEDLGRGWLAGFRFETGLDLDDGASVGDAFWARQANVWLGGAWGEVRLGRQLAPSNSALYAFEVTGDSSYGVLANTYGYAGMPARMSSAISITSARVDGWQTAIAVASRHDGGSRGDVWDVGMNYEGAVQDGRRLAAGIALNQGADGAGRLNWLAGARYELGDASQGRLAFAASYTRRQLDDSRARREGVSLGALLHAGAVRLALDVVRDRKNELSGHAGKKHTNATLEGRYYFSRTTFAYGAALRLDGDNNWGVGLRHNF